MNFKYPRAAPAYYLIFQHDYAPSGTGDNGALIHQGVYPIMAGILDTPVCVLGAGNIGRVVLSALVRMEHRAGLWASVRSHDSLKSLRSEFGDTVTCCLEEADVLEAIRGARIIVIGVKKDQLPGLLLPQVREALCGRCAVFLCAGIDGGRLRELLSYHASSARMARALPSPICRIGKGLTILSRDHTMNRDDEEVVLEMFRIMGRPVMVAEEQMHVACAMVSSTVLNATIVEAIVDAGVLLGLSRADAMAMAPYALAGSADMMSNGLAPHELREEASTPAGVTINMLMEAEHAGLRSALVRAMVAGSNASREMA